MSLLFDLVTMRIIIWTQGCTGIRSQYSNWLFTSLTKRSNTVNSSIFKLILHQHSPGLCTTFLNWSYFPRKNYYILTFEVGGRCTPHDVPSAALFTQAAKASIRSLQPSAPFSATLEGRMIMSSILEKCLQWHCIIWELAMLFRMSDLRIHNHCPDISTQSNHFCNLTSGSTILLLCPATVVFWVGILPVSNTSWINVLSHIDSHPKT